MISFPLVSSSLIEDGKKLKEIKKGIENLNFILYLNPLLKSCYIFFSNNKISIVPYNNERWEYKVQNIITYPLLVRKPYYWRLSSYFIMFYHEQRSFL